ncbi:MAG TPA: ABC transporter ATP-binding protein [Clostridiaceae bacterium]|jgi:ABC-type multidrug transport system ATPase subunit|nr:ABC transporter ATP-binding protein [Clostridiaceae bacterium]HBF77644.1 ABC transporter ATP-binding protein [Clostridiaceae bacterium]HBG39222.1 ABC transporter ATP-binding protein [Clostridiaceae bacterium]HBN28617.1 ABC transporter ATP-binding protein [Clostridiaceae bacterium]HBX47627.1 ABC transporter ATP-binding protein [Clostridiaceae bacterium]
MKLEIRNVTKKYGKFCAVKNFSYEFTEGVYGLLGPNGAGKTTIIRILADVLNPTDGSVMLNGEDIKDMDYRYRNLIGYLPQDFGVYKNFTAHRFLMYIAALKGLSKTESQKRIEELLEITNLKEYSNVKTGTFSGGMKRRLGIAQALLNDPKILIMDEPTAGLDPKERVRFRNLLSEISKDKIVILSTHIVSDIEYISKEIVLIKKGEILKTGSSESLTNEIKGKVWKVLTDENGLKTIEERFTVGNIFRNGNKIETRIISENRPDDSAEAEIPTMEDVFLYYFDELSE